MKDNGPEYSIEVYRLPANRDTEIASPPNELDRRDAAFHLQHSFNLLLSENRELARFMDRLRTSEVNIVIFGGWARDRLIEMLHQNRRPSRDIDFVAHGRCSIAKVLPDSALKNPFGGFGFDVETMHVDIWNLRDTFLIRRNHLPIAFKQLPFTADYTANAVVFMPSQFFGKSQVIEHGAINAIKNRELDFAASEVAFPKVQAARAIILSLRLGFEMSSSVREFVEAITAPFDDLEYVENGLRSYCPPHLLPKALNLLLKIRNKGR